MIGYDRTVTGPPTVAKLARRLKLAWSRAPRPASELVLTRRQVYILPTRHGILFGVVLLAMLLGAINYANSLAYALTFLLASVAVVSILHTYRNLGGLTIRSAAPRSIFAGEEALFPLLVENGEGFPRLALTFESEGFTTTVDLPPRETARVELRLPAERRGWRTLRRVTLSTRYPLGLFRAWSRLHLRQRCLVYPRPDPHRELPPTEGAGGDGAGSGQGGDEFAGLRGYRRGDPPQRLHWKALARGQGLVIKEFHAGGDRELWLRWEGAAPLPAEARLSRLCRWVLLAERQNLAFALALPGRVIGPASGAGHVRRCLEALALYGDRS